MVLVLPMDFWGGIPMVLLLRRHCNGASWLLEFYGLDICGRSEGGFSSEGGLS